MNEIQTLLLIELRSFFGINKFLHTRDKKEKNRYRGLCAAWIILTLMVFGYIGSLVFGLCYLGLSNIVPAYLGAITSIMLLFFGLFTAGNRIFSTKGYDILMAMPVGSGSVVISRFLGHYITDMILSTLIMLPGMVVYGILVRPGVLFYVYAPVGIVLIPAIPLAISTVIGTVILAISSRAKNKSIIQSLLLILFVVGVLIGSFQIGEGAENMTVDMFRSLAETAGNLIEKIYPPAIWLNQALYSSNILSLLLFAGISVATIFLTVFAVSHWFHSIIGKLLSFSAKHSYTLEYMESRSALKALYKREVKRYFASSIYVTNTILGPILGMVMAVAIAVSGLDVIQSVLPADVNVADLLPFAIAAVFTMMPPSSVSVSMEGKQFWIIKSIPVSTKDWLDSKILLNLSLSIPFLVIAEIVMAIMLRPDLITMLWLVLIPVVLILFAVVFGITVNLKFHSFDWEKEESVVKQSLPAFLGGMFGLFISFLLGFAVYLIPQQFANTGKTVICIAVAALTLWLYHSNIKKLLSAL